MKNKNVSIYVFSGTGNTLLIANKIAENLIKDASCACEVFRMESTDPKSVKQNSLIGIGFTVACWNTYPFVRKWIDDMPQSDGTEVFLFNTMGDSSLNMLSQISKILRKKGYVVTALQEFVMPNNFLLIEPQEKKNRKTAAAFAKAETFAKDITSETRKSVKSGLLPAMAFIVTTFLIKTWKFKIWQKIIKFKIDKNKCTKCGICSEICPVGNISMPAAGFPEFGARCQFCLRCISYCPQQAMKSRLLYKNKTHRALSLEEIKWK